MTARPDSIARLVRKRASATADSERLPGSFLAGPDPASIRREVGVLTRCEVPGIVRLVGFGERPVPWLETSDAGDDTMATPPPRAADRLAALAALARALAGLHRRGWVHLSLEPDHVIWRGAAAHGSGASGFGGDIEVTLCSLGAAVCPAGPAERAADREALAAIMALTMLAPGGEVFAPRIRTAISAVANDLRAGDVDDLDAVAAGLDSLVSAARRDGAATSGGARTYRRGRDDRIEQVRFGWLARSFPRAPVARVALFAALGLALLGGTVAFAGHASQHGRSAGSAAPRCARPTIGPPRVDPDGSGCGRPVGYRSSVLTVGTDRWKLGDGIVDGRWVDLDRDGWSELAALRQDGEVFIVRRFPSDPSDPVQVRSVATAPGARRLDSSGGVGLDGLRALRSDGTPIPLVPISTGPDSGASSGPVSTAHPYARDGSVSPRMEDTP